MQGKDRRTDDEGKKSVMAFRYIYVFFYSTTVGLFFNSNEIVLFSRLLVYLHLYPWYVECGFVSVETGKEAEELRSQLM